MAGRSSASQTWRASSVTSRSSGGSNARPAESRAASESTVSFPLVHGGYQVKVGAPVIRHGDSLIMHTLETDEKV